MYRHVHAVALVVIALCTWSCSDSDTALRSSLTQPTAIDPAPVSVVATASTVVAQPVDNPFCPLVAPFNIVLSVVVKPNGTSTVFITNVRLQFTDTSGLRAPQVTLPMPQVTLPAPIPTSGSSMVQTVSGTTIPLVFGIGCGGIGRQGTLIVIVETTDDQGNRGSQSVSVAVR
jgi:hypothetical protein